MEELLLSDKYIPLFTTGFIHPNGGWPDFSLPQLSQLQFLSYFHHLDLENLGHPLSISCWTLQLGRWMNLNVICWGVLGVLKITTFEGWKYVRRFTTSIRCLSTMISVCWRAWWRKPILSKQNTFAEDSTKFVATKLLQTKIGHRIYVCMYKYLDLPKSAKWF